MCYQVDVAEKRLIGTILSTFSSAFFRQKRLMNTFSICINETVNISNVYYIFCGLLDNFLWKKAVSASLDQKIFRENSIRMNGICGLIKTFNLIGRFEPQ